MQMHRVKIFSLFYQLWRVVKDTWKKPWTGCYSWGSLADCRHFLCPLSSHAVLDRCLLTAGHGNRQQTFFMKKRKEAFQSGCSLGKNIAIAAIDRWRTLLCRCELCDVTKGNDTPSLSQVLALTAGTASLWTLFFLVTFQTLGRVW